MAKWYGTDRERSQVTRLVHQAQGGDRTAFGQLFILFRPHVLALARRRLRDEADAQELCQDVFIQVLQKLGQLRVAECFPAWLRSIALRMAINRRVRRRPLLAIGSDVIESECVELRTPLRAALEKERIRDVRAGISRLKPMDREALQAFYLEGRTLREISARLNAPLGTIKRRLHTARRRFSAEMEDHAGV